MKVSNTWKKIAVGTLALTLVSGTVPAAPISQAFTNLTAISASADTFEDFIYEVKDGTACITGYTGRHKDVVIPSTIGGMKVTGIGNAVFSFNQKLESITIPEGVTSIGKGAFGHCDGLTEITIPDSVTSVGKNAFEDCENLESITVGEDNENYSSLDGVLYNKDKTELICCPGGKTSVTIPDGVTSIGDEAFSRCGKLTEVAMSDTVTSIGNEAFSRCINLTDITMSDSLISIGEHAFFSCTSLTEITIPDSVTTIEDYAFYSCTGITEITIPDSVTSVGVCALERCGKLESITAGENNENYSSLDGVLYNKDKTELVRCPEAKASVDIPDGVTSIGERAFARCIPEEITLPDSVTEIGQLAFSTCPNLTGMIIPDGVTEISKYAFVECKNLTDITLPDSITSICDYAFGYCKSLKGITIPDGVSEIGMSAFYGCNSLEDITIPENVTSIGDLAFDECKSLKDVNFGGTKEQWDAIKFGKYNDCLLNAAIHYKDSHAWPKITSIDYNAHYHQFRLNWSEVPNAQNYGVAVYLKGKWYIQNQKIHASVTSYTSPKLKKGQTYKMLVVAKVDGKWDLDAMTSRVFEVTVK